MALDQWIAFAAASLVLVINPGPTVLLVVSYALGHGRRSALATVAGVALGDFTGMTASMLGLGMLLATSSLLFTGLKWLGAAYLVYLGVKLWRAPVSEEGIAAARPEATPRRMLLHAYAVTALNPNGILFFVAFVPQFLVASRPVLPQMVILEATFLAIATTSATAYALAASAARRVIRRPAVQRTVNRLGGTLLIGAGLLTVTWRRASA